MKIVTLNIRTAARDKWPWNKHYWVRRMREFKRFVNTEQPDIICLQEVTRIQLWCIKRIKGYKTYTNKMKFGLFAECQPIMVCNKYTDKMHHFETNIGGVKMKTAVVVYTPDDISIMNVHLPLNRNERYDEICNIMGTRGYRMHSVIVGDFNASLGDDSFEPLERTGKHRFFMPKESTFRNFNTGTDASIDGFITRMWEYPSYPSIDVLARYDKISDHYPVMLEFKI